ncbi:MAG TPA: chitobiase/beta-hexosaminidase C-terminal domain-containing protein [Chitinispirillaceae bacterium]|nr:chitobiase/beta-hexosaminidase C-terminal domain-containing protein [Chitinispirillaceae bacterium]
MCRIIFYSFFFSFLLICENVESASGKKETPEWLDTIAPQVTVYPDSLYHNSIFHISFSSNKRSVIWYSIATPYEMTQYGNPITISKQGACKIYYYGEDDFGNRSALDSITYILDSRPPVISVIPSAGVYPAPVTVRIKSDEFCSLYYQEDGTDQPVLFFDSLQIKDSFEGVIIAEDRAGNRSSTAHLKYSIDTSSFNMKIEPAGGIFNRSVPVTLSASADVTLFYSFDPLAPPEYFSRYERPFFLPHGLTILRYYGKRFSGNESEILKARYIVDTIAPKLQINVSSGKIVDTVDFYCREKAIIRYTLDKSVPNSASRIFESPLLIPHRGLSTVKARAWDDAGNLSEILVWEYKYDHTSPNIKISHQGGIYNRAQSVYFTSDEPVKIFYTMDGSAVKESSPLYVQTGISISRNDTTILRYYGVDEAGNRTDEKKVVFILDTRPPEVRIRIDHHNQDSSAFIINIQSNEPAAIYFTTDGSDPESTSSVYNEPLKLRFGNILKYFAIDRTGNRSQIKIMDDLKRPMVVADPDGGVFNRKLKISFLKNSMGTVFWRTAADTGFKKVNEFVEVKEDGTHILEYFIENDAGIKSAIRRSIYYVDKIAPFVQISLRQGMNDSVVVFFECSEPASIYYTTDGTNPLLSKDVGLLGNKFNQTSDRISLKRSSDIKLAFCAEDGAGNQSPVSVLDVFKPRVVPNVASGVDRLYDRILSISLNSYDQSTIYYERHGGIPSTASKIYSEPFTLMESDTITAFVIDASGYRGDIDTFIYIIDLPPSPHFTTFPDTVYKGMEVVFDPAGSLDKESTFEKLKFRWDFNGDGIFDSDYGKYAKVKYKYEQCGLFKPLLEVIDINEHKASVSRTVLVRERCTSDMVSVIDAEGHAFCIDRYEWPNFAGMKPATGVSWVEAKMSCIDAGKRLCTRKEWEAACRGDVKSVYPYGEKYNGKQCPTEGKSVWKSGLFSDCNKYRVADMIGNAWEWVENRDQEYRLMMGGSYLSGSDAHCGLFVQGTVATSSDETGFRCCK